MITLKDKKKFRKQINGIFNDVGSKKGKVFPVLKFNNISSKKIKLSLCVTN
jgi:hypothetical protein